MAAGKDGSLAESLQHATDTGELPVAELGDRVRENGQNGAQQKAPGENVLGTKPFSQRSCWQLSGRVAPEETAED